MTILKSANRLRAANSVLNSMVNSAREKLSDYCKNRIIQLGLVPKSFSHELHFGASAELRRKTVGRLNRIIYRNLVKSVPFVSFTENEFLTVEDRESLVINVVSSGWTKDLNKVAIGKVAELGGGTSSYNLSRSESARRIYLAELPETKWVNRYCNFLNRQCIKNSIPVEFSNNCSMIFEPNAKATSANISNPTERNSFQIDHRVDVRIKVKSISWVISNSSRSRTYVKCIEENTPVPEEIYDLAYWETMYDRNGDSLPDFYKFCTAKMFLHFDKIFKVLSTLSRKASYGASAFTFRNSEDA